MDFASLFRDHYRELIVVLAGLGIGIPIASLLLFLATWYSSTVFSPAALRKAVAGKRVLIVGGSKGLGRAYAILCAKAGAHVTIVARGEESLRAAADEIKSHLGDAGGSVKWVSCDATDYRSVQRAVKTITGSDRIAPNWVFCVAGTAVPDFVANQTGKGLYERHFKMNVLTSTNFVDALVEFAAESGRAGHPVGSEVSEDGKDTIIGLKPEALPFLPQKFIFAGSGVGLCSFAGYTHYGMSKFALRGYTDALRHELLPLKIGVHHVVPQNIDTESFAIENLTKPAVTAKIEGKGLIMTPDQIAKGSITPILKGTYMFSTDALLELARVSIAGPTDRPMPILETLAGPLVVFISVVYSAMNDMDILGFYKSFLKSLKIKKRE
ncbi:hypothetical protein BJ742DRAFT_775652 [Cladochytrium replicatum]|nr:hypothetical protein BJ742DRAFT_775652 [Cladochytrium replicatum]